MLYDLLYDWQKRIVDKFKDRESFGLFLDMGLGKTPLSLAFAEVKDCTKIIVITLNSKALESKDVRGSWFNWGTKMKHDYNLLNKYTNVFQNDSEFFLINYESLFSRSKDRLQRVQLKENVLNFIESCKSNNVAIIVDESHKMKNLSSIQTKAIFHLQKLLKVKAKNVYTYLLSGTPFTSGYIDLYTQLKILGCEMTKTEFINRFCERDHIAGLYDWQQPIKSYKNIDELFKLVHKYAVTIESDSVIDLPEKVFVNHPLPFSKDFLFYTNEQLKKDVIFERLKTLKQTADVKEFIYEHEDLSNKLINNPFYRNINYPDFDWLAETNGQFWLRARQLSIGFQGNAENSKWFDMTRLNSIKTFLSENENNYIIFYNYTSELFELFKICQELGYNIDVYCGEVKSLYFYEKYQNQSKAEKLTNRKNIILSNFASGSTGMNWQEYSNCIIFSLPVYKDYAQALKRVHRIGQIDTVVYHIFYQENWLDRSMKKALEEQTTYTLDMFESDLKRVKSFIDD